MKTLIIISLLLIGKFSEDPGSSFAPEKTLQEALTMRIRDRLVNCDGLEGRTSCYQVQKGAAIGGEEWEMIPGDIENFRYEEGFQYDLSVEMTLVPNAENGQAKYSYRLLEVLSKTKI